MADSKDLIQQVAREIEASHKTSPTPAGPTEAIEPASPAHRSASRVEAINQVFALFRLNYHNQFFAAYSEAEQLNQVKRLWLDSLGDYPVEQILQGAKHAIENSEYLPTLHRMLECCQAGLGKLGLPTARDAYIEACRAGSPKSAQAWSHPAVYLAGRDSDWFFLANNTEDVAWPVFREHYQRYCGQALAGEELSIPAPESIERQPQAPMSTTAQQAALKKLREETGL
ncbi:MAG: replication protein P [Pseudomonadota bacterium]